VPDANHELMLKRRLLLERYVHFYESLDSGARVPTTDAQKHFVAVCRGEVEPETEHEWAWVTHKKAAQAEECRRAAREEEARRRVEMSVERQRVLREARARARGYDPLDPARPGNEKLILDSDFLAEYGWFYRGLDEGSEEPVTELQRHFVAVCRGEAQPETRHELVWAKVSRLLKQRGEARSQRQYEWNESRSSGGFATDDDWMSDPGTIPPW
jgi:uncharacterized protein YifE (UPF0438 family)